MLKLITLVCILAAALHAVLTFSWLRGKRGHGPETARVYGILCKRKTSYCRYQYAPVIFSAAILCVAVGVGVSWTSAAVYMFGAVVTLLCFIIGITPLPAGTSAAYSSASGGSILDSLRASFRVGSVMGSFITTSGILMIGSLFLIFDIPSAISLAASLGLGVTTVTFIINTSGNVYSAAYSLAVQDDDFPDQTGLISGLGADLMDSYVLSSVAAIMLAQVGVDTSGTYSTFTIDEPARFPVILLASGIASSIIASLFFRGRDKGNPAAGIIIPCIIAGIISAAAALYFSIYYMQSYAYGICAVIGIAAGILLAEISRFFSYDSRLMVRTAKTDKRLGTHQSVIFNLSSGMLSVFFDSLLITSALALSYMYARLYGMAICAVGLTSIAGTIAAVGGFSVVTGASAEIISAENDDSKELNTISEFLDTASIRATAPVRSLLSTLSTITSFALFIALSYSSEISSVDMLNLKVISGAFGGVASVFVLLGLVIWSVKATGIVALNNMSSLDEEKGATGAVRGSLIPAVAAIVFPTSTGLFFGIEVLIGFLCSAVVTGSLLRTVIEHSGQHFRNSAVMALGSLIKMMIIFSAVFAPAIIKIGGLII